MRQLRPEASALVELGILFLPAIPAYIWFWPHVSGTAIASVAESLAYLYVFGGALFIGLRRWTWSQLGVNRLGIGLSLICGAVLIAERALAQVVLGLPLTLRPFSLGRVVGEVVFYLGLVGVVEELLFRGLMFRALENWRGPGLAVFGSALGFALWHIGWAGPLIVVHFGLGLVFGLIRWRAGGIVGLVFVHGLFDLMAVETQTPPNIGSIDQLLQIVIVNRPALFIGDALLLALIFYLWIGRQGLLPLGHGGQSGSIR